MGGQSAYSLYLIISASGKPRSVNSDLNFPPRSGNAGLLRVLLTTSSFWRLRILIMGLRCFRDCSSSIQAQLLPQPGRPVGGDAIHAGAGESPRLARRIDGPDV